ncbi:hypothetical protein AcV5_009512 [Taiwanofungus camphoratus]|nr:hypothetical protein AcV5_009512 [Antrodia cinnamomea]
MSVDYKASKEAFVSGMTGSSIGHINMVSLAALSSIALHSALRTRLHPNITNNFWVELLILVLPLLLSITLFANAPGLLNLIILIPTGLLLLMPRRELGTPLPSSLSPSRASSPSRERDYTTSSTRDSSNAPMTTRIPSLPPLTTYRAHMLLLTFLSILAVDFPVFPRSLAKCETFGASMMDLGVGSFVFSQGIVSAIPIIKNPSYLTQPALPKLAAVARKCLPLLLLGLLRTISVKGVDYPEHHSEYGVHWNFFITLALIPVLQVLLHPLMMRLPISLLGFLLALSQQLALSPGGLTKYVFDAPRATFVSANKEGLVSLFGYLAIHLLGLSTGALLFPPSPSHFRRRLHQLVQSDRGHARTHRYSSDSDSENDDSVRSRAHRQPTQIQERRENDKTAIELCSYAIVWWVLLGAVKAFGVGGGISRRLVNLQYILWVSAYNTTFLLGYLFLDLFFFPSPLSRSTYSSVSKLKVHPDPTALSKHDNRGCEVERGAPALLEAVNRNGLVLFLLANIATGLINLSMATMYMLDWAAMLVLSLYASGISGVAWIHSTDSSGQI